MRRIKRYSGDDYELILAWYLGLVALLGTLAVVVILAKVL